MNVFTIASVQMRDFQRIHHSTAPLSQIWAFKIFTISSVVLLLMFDWDQDRRITANKSLAWTLFVSQPPGCNIMTATAHVPTVRFVLLHNPSKLPYFSPFEHSTNLGEFHDSDRLFQHLRFAWLSHRSHQIASCFETDTGVILLLIRRLTLTSDALGFPLICLSLAFGFGCARNPCVVGNLGVLDLAKKGSPPTPCEEDAFADGSAVIFHPLLTSWHFLGSRFVEHFPFCYAPLNAGTVPI